MTISTVGSEYLEVKLTHFFRLINIDVPEKPIRWTKIRREFILNKDDLKKGTSEKSSAKDYLFPFYTILPEAMASDIHEIKPYSFCLII